MYTCTTQPQGLLKHVPFAPERKHLCQNQKDIKGNRPVTFSALLDDWLCSMSSSLKPTTFSTYSAIIENHIRPRLGTICLNSLSNEDIEGFMTIICAESSGLASSTVRGITNVLRSVLVLGGKHGSLVDPEACRCSRKSPKTEICVLTDDEQRRLLVTLGKNPKNTDLGILICLKTGLRVGEVCALKWGNISFSSGLLTVDRTVQRIKLVDGGKSKTVLYFGEPKSVNSKRKIPLSPSLLEVLQKNRGGDDCFLLSGRAEKTVEPRSMQRRFKTVLRHAGIRDMNFHVLRHTFATKCVDLGFDVKSLSMILGHSSVNTTMNTYVHPSMEKVRSMMAMLD